MLIFLTTMLFGVVFLSACGNDNTNEDDENNFEPEEQTEETETEDDSTSDNNDEANDGTDNSNETEQDESNTAEEDNTTKENQSGDTDSEIVAENEAFRIFEPTPDAVVGNEFTVRGEARVYEAHIMYEFEDGHNVLDEGNVTASQGAPAWGEFKITISFDEVAHGVGTVILYEESAKDGSRVNELFIPVTIE